MTLATTESSRRMSLIISRLPAAGNRGAGVAE